MPRTARFFPQGAGTRFLVYPQPRTDTDIDCPEVLHLDHVHGRIRPGPQDDSTYVVDAVDKDPYRDDDGTYLAFPPWEGRARAALAAGPDGHFDQLNPRTRDFSAAAMFATVRYVRAVWEHHAGHDLDWWFGERFRRLELVPRVRSATAWSGIGFIECGFPQVGGTPDHNDPFANNFDVVAHETGHLILKRLVGDPFGDDKPFMYRAHEEAGADLVAMLASLHFDSVVDILLRETRGNLFSSNIMSRFGELRLTRGDGSREIRRLYNNETMATVKDAIREGQKHRVALPFSGALFDVLIETYETGLVARGLVTAAAAARSRHDPLAAGEVPASFAQAFVANPGGFKDALLDARDTVGGLLAEAWSRVKPRRLSYGSVVSALIAADRRLNRGRNRRRIVAAFARRQIAPP